MPNVEIVHWNPPRVRNRFGRILLPFTGRVNNFGDLLGPRIVNELLRVRNIPADRATKDVRVLAVGSILKLARAGDVVWGAGVNGKSIDRLPIFDEVSIRAVRGPLSSALIESRGGNKCTTYGDPALLLGTLEPREPASHRSGVVIIPNLNDHRYLDHRLGTVIQPTESLEKIRAAILQAEIVIGSSLHAIVVAEAYGIPARIVRSEAEPAFKYEDYYEGTGRSNVVLATSVSHALEVGGAPLPKIDLNALTEAFPSDLWGVVGDNQDAAEK